MKKLFIFLCVIVLSACANPIDEVTTYKLIPATGDAPAICMAYTDIVEIIEPGETVYESNGNELCPLVRVTNTPAKTETICSVSPKPVSLRYCGIYIVGDDIRGFKKIDDITTCYSKTFGTILPLHYCLPNTRVNTYTNVSQSVSIM